MVLYEEIDKNNRMTIILFVIFSLFYGVVVFFFLILLGFYPDLPLFSTATLTILVLSYLFVSSSGANFVLALSGAKEIQKKDYPYLYNTVEGLSIAADIPTPKIYVIESEALNAFATGLKPEKSYIAVTTGLLKKMNRLELEGVIAHEISHIKNYDIRTMLVAAVLAMAIALLADMGIRIISARSSRDRISGLELVALLFLILAPFISFLIRMALSRNREYAADASAAMLTRYPAGLADALQKIKEEYEKKPVELPGVNEATRPLFIFDPMKKSLLSLFSTHPPIEDRIARLRKM